MFSTQLKNASPFCHNIYDIINMTSLRHRYLSRINNRKLLKIMREMKKLLIFLLFRQCFLLHQKIVSPFVIIFMTSYLQGPKNFKIVTRPSAILHSSYSKTKKDNPLALTKFFLVRTSRRMDSLDCDLYLLLNWKSPKMACEVKS